MFNSFIEFFSIVTLGAGVGFFAIYLIRNIDVHLGEDDDEQGK